MRQDRNGDAHAGARFCRPHLLERKRVLSRQQMRVPKERNKTERRPPGRLRNACHRIGEQCGIATKFVDDEPAYQACVLGLDHRFGADDAGDHAAAVDITDQHNRHIGRLREAHIGDVVGTQIDLGGAAGALDQYEIGHAAHMPVARQDGGQ